MNLEAINSDPLEIDREYPALLECFTLNSNECRLNCTLYIAQGRGPHPTIILFHGFPGYEKNFDLAQVFRRAGYNVMIFHYRGSWGSEGFYSVNNVLEDADAAIDFLRSEKCKKSYRVDSENIILIGHSLGGFTALMTAAKHPEIKLVASLAGFNVGLYGDMLFKSEKLFKSSVELWKDSMLPLRGITAEEFLNSAIENKENWNLINLVKKLKSHSILMVAGSRDDTATIEEHHIALVDSLPKGKAANLKSIILDSDHSFSDKRIALSEVVLSWLLEQNKKCVD
ncbi:alpha/beta fold hydrolase [Clostridiaceae bacterium UIB06]|uniref:Alpha/beta fold hydrolase n=1 Tax=Clostridium thailandense TaxID=2794346 RepID=A0A949TW24_9CLOT|nr:alpha/beta fold hydrolase [Clostridium thailandense]MBV7272023.1 alpha/beta fold hydrolase [Clostridium thailandense]MCH5137421.1 alpha/beta fold hydrolase [Clostridiaceae bacterium UIB06]